MCRLELHHYNRIFKFGWLHFFFQVLVYSIYPHHLLFFFALEASVAVPTSHRQEDLQSGDGAKGCRK